MMRRLVPLLGVLACARGQPRFEPPGPLELLSNIDDDDGDHIRDGLDERPNGDADLRDFSAVAMRAPCPSAELELTLEPASAAEHLHVFEDGRLILGQRRPQTSLPCGTHALNVEALRTRSSLWDGRAALVAWRGAARVARIDLRVAPVIVPDVLCTATRLYAVDVSLPEARANEAVLSVLRSLNLPLTLAPGRAHHFERWMKDALTTGVQSRASGQSQEILIAMDRPTGEQGLEGFAATQLGPDRGLALTGRDEVNVLSYGGNIEVIPAHARFSSGRLLVGGSTLRKMGASSKGWLEAQESQAPLLELPTDWLETGHIDELISFVPSTQGPGWAVLIASPRAAWARLEALHRQQHRAGPLRTSRGEMSIDALLGDSKLRAFNEGLFGRLDAMRTVLEHETGVTNFIEVPQLFTSTPAGLAVALHPSLVNLVSVGWRAVSLSSDTAGDVFEPMLHDALMKNGVSVVFVDGTHAYHELGGGLHCAVEVQRRGAAVLKAPDHGAADR